MGTFNTVLLKTLEKLDTGTLYELFRGLILSDCDVSELKDLLGVEVTKRAEEARQRLAEMAGEQHDQA